MCWTVTGPGIVPKAVPAGSGAVDTATQRVTIANDSTGASPRSAPPSPPARPLPILGSGRWGSHHGRHRSHAARGAAVSPTDRSAGPTDGDTNRSASTRRAPSGPAHADDGWRIDHPLLLTSAASTNSTNVKNAAGSGLSHSRAVTTNPAHSITFCITPPPRRLAARHQFHRDHPDPRFRVSGAGIRSSIHGPKPTPLVSATASRAAAAPPTTPAPPLGCMNHPLQ